MNDKILFLYAQGMTTREIVATFKEMYGACVSASLISKVIEDEAVLALNQFAERWAGQCPQVSKSWQAHWQKLSTLFNYPADIREVIYTSNAI